MAPLLSPALQSLLFQTQHLSRFLVPPRFILCLCKHKLYPVFFCISFKQSNVLVSSTSFSQSKQKKRYSIFFYVISQTRPVSRFLLLCIIHHTFSYGFSFSILFLWDTVSSFLFGPILLACVIVMLFCTPSRYHYSLCGTAQHHLPYCTMP